MDIDTIRLYLPKYLSPESEKELFSELKKFPENLDSRFYISRLDNNVILQGDGLKDLLVINLPDTDIRAVNAMVLSNTCDLELENERKFSTKICYSPIVNLKKYKERLIKKGYKSREESAKGHLDSVRNQEITQVFYLPAYGDVLEESIVFLDRISSCRNASVDRTSLPDRRIFTLSNYGNWLFLLKLSIHFTRINDKIDRISA